MERVMPVLNLGLQGVALSREVMDDGKFEKDFKKCNGMSGVRTAAEAYEINIVGSPMVDEVNAKEVEEQQELMQHQLHEEDEELMLLLRHEEDEREHLLLKALVQ
jgi:hypothetical protein